MATPFILVPEHLGFVFNSKDKWTKFSKEQRTWPVSFVIAVTEVMMGSKTAPFWTLSSLSASYAWETYSFSCLFPRLAFAIELSNETWKSHGAMSKKTFPKPSHPSFYLCPGKARDSGLKRKIRPQPLSRLAFGWGLLLQWSLQDAESCTLSTLHGDFLEGQDGILLTMNHWCSAKKQPSGTRLLSWINAVRLRLGDSEVRLSSLQSCLPLQLTVKE